MINHGSESDKKLLGTFCWAGILVEGTLNHLLGNADGGADPFKVSGLSYRTRVEGTTEASASVLAALPGRSVGFVI